MLQCTKRKAMIKAPGWASHAIPTVRGWEDPITGELLKSGRHTEAQISEWFGHPTVTETWLVEETPAAEEVETDEPMEDLESMTKLELEALGREHGIELDRREKKDSLVSQLSNWMKK